MKKVASGGWFCCKRRKNKFSLWFLLNGCGSTHPSRPRTPRPWRLLPLGLEDVEEITLDPQQPLGVAWTDDLHVQAGTDRGAEKRGRGSAQRGS